MKKTILAMMLAATAAMSAPAPYPVTINSRSATAPPLTASGSLWRLRDGEWTVVGTNDATVITGIQGATTGDVLQFGAGTYTIGTLSKNLAGVVLIGQGPGEYNYTTHVPVGGTILSGNLYASGTNASFRNMGFKWNSSYANSYLLAMMGEGQTVRNCSFYGTRANTNNTHSLYVEGDHAMLDHISVYDTWNHGIAIKASDVDIVSPYCWSNYYNITIRADISDVDNVRVTSPRIQHGAYGLLLQSDVGYNLTDITVDDAMLDGLSVAGAYIRSSGVSTADTISVVSPVITDCAVGLTFDAQDAASLLTNCLAIAPSVWTVSGTGIVETGSGTSDAYVIDYWTDATTPTAGTFAYSQVNGNISVGGLTIGSQTAAGDNNLRVEGAMYVGGASTFVGDVAISNLDVTGTMTATNASLVVSNVTAQVVSATSVNSQIPIYTAAYGANHTNSAAECYGSVIYVTGAATITLPSVAVGMSFTVCTVGGTAVSVDPAAADKIVLDGTALDDGDKVTNLSTAGDIVVFTYYSADGWYAASNGWTDGS